MVNWEAPLHVNVHANGAICGTLVSFPRSRCACAVFVIRTNVKVFRAPECKKDGINETPAEVTSEPGLGLCCYKRCQARDLFFSFSFLFFLFFLSVPVVSYIFFSLHVN